MLSREASVETFDDSKNMRTAFPGWLRAGHETDIIQFVFKSTLLVNNKFRWSIISRFSVFPLISSFPCSGVRRRQHNNHLLSIRAIVDKSSSRSGVSIAKLFLESIFSGLRLHLNELSSGWRRARVKLRRLSISLQTLSVPERIKIYDYLEDRKKSFIFLFAWRAWKNIQKRKKNLIAARRGELPMEIRTRRKKSAADRMCRN